MRDVNDFHHAKDAYVNIVVGNVYHTKFTTDPAHFLREKNARYSLNPAMYDYPVVRDGVTAWTPGDDGTIAVVKRWMGKNNILFTRRSYRQQGGLFDQMPVKKGQGQVPLKADGSPIGDIEKYGGYNKAAVSYFMYVQGKDKKGNPAYLFVPVLLYRAGALRTDADREAYCLEEWQREKAAFTEPRILLREIPYNALLELRGYRMHISSRSNVYIFMKNAVELCLSEEQAALVKRIGKFLERSRTEKGSRITAYDRIEEADLMALYDVFSDKLNRGIYREKMQVQAEALKKGREAFAELPPEGKSAALMEILHLFQCNPVLSNLSSIGGKSKTGTITISFNATKQEGLTLVTQSVTGFFERRIPLVPFGRP